jgi:hypothetical protein
MVSYYRKELLIYKKINKKKMAEAVKVLSYVTQTSWPYGMAHIREI